MHSGSGFDTTGRAPCTKLPLAKRAPNLEVGQLPAGSGYCARGSVGPGGGGSGGGLHDNALVFESALANGSCAAPVGLPHVFGPHAA